MNCPACRYENPAEARFCLECGALLPPHCPRCGNVGPAEAKFCMACGYNLSESVPASAPAPPHEPAPPSTAAPGGERRQATVLFSDLSGFTAMNERLDPEEVTGITMRFKETAERVVTAHGGTVNQFVGDEVFALFGIPAAHEDDPQRALRAALELHEAVRKLSDELEARLGETLRLHSGINTGLVVSSASDGMGGRYNVTGDTVNTAARLVSRAEMDQIIIGAATRRQVSPFFDLEELEPVALKGKARPLVTYRLLGASGVASRFDAAEARGFTPYTGREGDLAVLQEALERSKSGQGQFVTLSGEAGLGKSRLLYEFRRLIDREAVTVLQGRCQSFGQATPYLPLTNALRRGLGLRDEDSLEQLHDKAVANLRGIDPALEEYLPVFLHLLSIATTEHPLPEHLQGVALRLASQEALAAVNLAHARRQPMVLMLEDWHWADEASDSALRRLLALLGAYPLMVVVNYRPEYEGGWSGAANHQHITLGPLSADHTSIIVNSVLEAERLPEGLGELIYKRTGGNPFFIEEMCLDLLEEGIVLVKDGQAALTRPAEKLDLPGTVQAVIRSRLDRLDEAQQEVLRLASVIGREFDHALLFRAHSALTGKETDIAPALAALIRQNLVQQVRVMPEAAYQFRHVLTQVVAYETLLHERRRELHGLIAETMERLYADRIDDYYETLAQHYSQSDDTERAVEYSELAGDKAAGIFSLEEARSHFHKAIALLDEQQLDKAGQRQRVELSIKLARTAILDLNPHWVSILEESLALAEELGDQQLQARALFWLGRMIYNTGNLSQAAANFHGVIQLAEDSGNGALVGLAYGLGGRTMFWDSEIQQCRSYLERAIPILRSNGELGEAIYNETFLGCSLMYLGEFRAASSLYDSNFQKFVSMENPAVETLANLTLAAGHLADGNWHKAVELGAGIALITRHGVPMLDANISCFQGFAMCFLGQEEQGLEMIKVGIAQLDSSGINLGHANYRALLSLACGLNGRGHEARKWAEDALEFGRAHAQRGFEQLSLAGLALAASLETPPDWEAVQGHMAEALTFCQERGLRPFTGQTHFRYAELLHKKGDRPDALAQLDQADMLFRDMEMTWWLEQAEALRGRLERTEPFRGLAPVFD